MKFAGKVALAALIVAVALSTFYELWTHDQPPISSVFHVLILISVVLALVIVWVIDRYLGARRGAP